MNNPPPLPDMPPINSAPPANEKLPALSQGSFTSPAFAGLRRVRQMVGSIAAGGLLLVAVLGGLQYAAPDALKPATIAATLEAQTELALMNQKLGAKPGVIKLTEAEYQEKIAEAQREGQAKAEIVYQREVAKIEADKALLIGAYQTLFQRANMLAQAAIQLETLAQQFRARLLEMSNGGRSTVIGIKDLFCGLGSEQACTSAHEDRRSMIAEADELSRGDVGARVRELMAGVDDPATLIAKTHQAQASPPQQ